MGVHAAIRAVALSHTIRLIESPASYPTILPPSAALAVNIDFDRLS